MTRKYAPVNIYEKIFFLIFLFSTTQLFAQTNRRILQNEFIFTKAPFAQCHASTLAETTDGLVAAWFGGTAEKNKDVEIWISREQEDGWTEPESVADGRYKETRYPCWNPVLYQVPGGELILFYKVGPDPASWWGILKRSFDHGVTWQSAELLPEGILGPIKNKPVLLNNGNLLCPSSTEDNGWRIRMERTSDAGRSWLEPVAVDPGNDFEAIQPAVVNVSGHALRILCRSRQGVIVTSHSPDMGKTWSALQATSLPNPNSGIDAVSLADGRHILVYNHATIPEGKWGGPRTPLNVAISDDAVHWDQVLVLEDMPGEYSYPAVIQTGDGLIHITYTWKRTHIRHVVLDPDVL